MSPHLCLCSAFQPPSQRAPQKLRFYSSVSQKRPQSLVQHQFLSPVIYRLPLRTSRGTPPNIYPVNTHSLVPFCLLLHIENLCERRGKTATNGAISLCWEHLCCRVFIKMTLLCLSHLFVLLSSSSQCFPLTSLFLCSERVEELPWYIVVGNVWVFFFFLVCFQVFVSC